MGFAPAVSTYSHSALPVTGYTAHSVASVPAVTNVAPITTYTAPVVSTYSHSALPVTSYAAQSVAAPTQVVSKQAPDHYLAHATPLGKALGVPSYVSKNGELEHVVEKREAEADPAVVLSGVLPTTYSQGVLPTTYSHGVFPTTYSQGVLPTTYSHGVLPTTYSHGVARQLNLYNSHVPVSYAGVYNAAHAVAATPLGLTHPSNVGLCFNNEGVQVSC